MNADMRICQTTDEQQHAGEMVLPPPTLLAEVRNKRPHWALRNSLLRKEQLGWKS